MKHSFQDLKHYRRCLQLVDELAPVCGHYVVVTNVNSAVFERISTMTRKIDKNRRSPQVFHVLVNFISLTVLGIRLFRCLTDPCSPHNHWRGSNVPRVNSKQGDIECKPDTRDHKDDWSSLVIEVGNWYPVLVSNFLI